MGIKSYGRSTKPTVEQSRLDTDLVETANAEVASQNVRPSGPAVLCGGEPKFKTSRVLPYYVVASQGFAQKLTGR